jgi:hypothetical protein
VSVLEVSQVTTVDSYSGDKITGMKVLKSRSWGRVVLIFLAAAATFSGAQSVTVGQDLAQGPLAREYWVDPSTGLMWAGKDSGKEVNWHKAMKYCRNMRLAGHSDWRLARIDELTGIFDRTVEAPGENPRSRWHEAEAMTYHVKGNLFLTGTQWSSTQIMDDRGKPSGYAWRFDFNEGRSFDGDELWFFTDKHALCVRGPGE